MDRPSRDLAAPPLEKMRTVNQRFDLDLVDAEAPSHAIFSAGFMATPAVQAAREGGQYAA